MKQYILLLIATILSPIAISQVSFADHIIMDGDETTDAVNFVYAIDMDLDGDLDVLTVAKLDNKIVWYKNINGSGIFGLQQMVTEINQPIWAQVEDVDEDGDMDVLSASISDDTIIWNENIDGHGTFGPPQLIATDPDSVYSLSASDMDGDGDIDVLSTSFFGENISVYKNDGFGNFGVRQNVLTNFIYSPFIDSRDLDGDNMIDIIVIEDYENKISWFKNLGGQNNFGPEQIITVEVDSPRNVFAVDIDGDSDMDLISASIDDDKIAWYENTDGLGNFGTQNIISNTADGAVAVYAVDIDNDGDMDVVSGSQFDDTIAYFENLDGFGTFSNKKIVSTEADGVLSVCSGDFNSDGYIDIVSANEYEDTISWFSNTDGLGTFGTKNYITRVNYLVTPSGIFVADLDGDGDMDMLSSSEADKKIAWYENVDGNENFGPQNIITNEADGAKKVMAVDVDNDGDIDVFSASYDDDKVSWFENLDGLGNFGPRILIGIVNGVSTLDLADIDGDGDYDLITGSFHNPQKLVWYENVDGQGTFGAERIISTNHFWITDVIAKDLDNDGDNDVVAVSSSDGKIAWYENNGLGSFGAQQLIFINFGMWSVFAGDFDGDNDQDLLSSSVNSSGDNLGWYENMDGQGSFGTQQSISSELSNPLKALAADLDLDGDLDVISSSFEDGVFWFENNGQGIFSNAQNISTIPQSVHDIYAKDIDGDGDIDLFTASYSDRLITYHENLNILSTQVYANNQFIVYPNPATGIVIIKSENKISKIVIYNNLGQFLISNKNKDNIDISNLDAGLYFLKATDLNGNTSTSQIIKE